MPNTVVVACKLPNGLWLEVSDSITWREIPSGEKLGYPVNSRKFFCRGSASARRMEVGEVDLRGNIAPSMMGETMNVVNGFGITQEIPADIWEQWVNENREYPPFKAGLIFAGERLDKVRDACREMGKSRKSGLEPINPPQLDRDGKPVAGSEPDSRMVTNVLPRNDV